MVLAAALYSLITRQSSPLLFVDSIALVWSFFMQSYFIPVTCASASSIARGLTQYGDAIIFHVCSGTLRVLTNAPEASSNLQFSVLCTAIMSITSLPLSIYLARKQILPNLPYGLALSSTGIAFLPLGTLALFVGNTSVLEIAVGVFFMLFAMVRLTSAILVKALQRNSESTETKATLTAEETVSKPESNVSLSETKETDTDIQIAPSNGFQLFSWLDSRIVSVSPKYSPSITLFVFAIAGAIAGFLNALMGTGGPPQMAAFALLEVPKDEIRGIATIFAMIELPIRISLWIGAAGSVWNPERDGSIYVSVAIASVFGFLIGAYFRAKVDTGVISNAMLVIIFLGAIVLLGGAKSMMIAIYCSIVTLLFLAFLVLVFMQPKKFQALLQRLWT